MSSDVAAAADLCGGTSPGLTNSGTIQTDVGSGGNRTLRGTISNQGTLSVNTNTTVPAAVSPCGANVALAGRLKVTRRGGKKSKRYGLVSVARSAVAAKPLKLTLKLPKRSLALLRSKGSKAVAKLTLTAKNANGQTSAPRTVKLKIKR